MSNYLLHETPDVITHPRHKLTEYLLVKDTPGYKLHNAVDFVPGQAA